MDGIAAYRAARARGEFADDGYGDVFLVVDGWPTLRKDFEDLEDVATDLAARGLAYGVHVIAACARSFDLRPATRDLFGSRIELRLGDPVDTAIDRVAAQLVPQNAPGRGVAGTKHQMHLALPRIDGNGDERGLGRPRRRWWTGARSGRPGSGRHGCACCRRTYPSRRCRRRTRAWR